MRERMRSNTNNGSSRATSVTVITEKEQRVWHWLGMFANLFSWILKIVITVAASIFIVLTCGIVSAIVLTVWFVALYCFVVNVLHWHLPW
jgi:Mg2+/Co2+ transporter CorB